MSELTNLTHLLQLAQIQSSILPPGFRVEVTEVESNRSLFRLTLDMKRQPVQRTDHEAVGEFIGRQPFQATDFMAKLQQVYVSQRAAGIQIKREQNRTGLSTLETVEEVLITTSQAQEIFTEYQRVVRQANDIEGPGR